MSRESISSEFPNTNRAVQKVQEYGLSATYRQRKSIFNSIRRCMALPFIPHQHMRTAFDHLNQKANSEELRRLTTYIKTRVFLYRGLRNSILILLITRNTCRPNTIYTDSAESSFTTNLKAKYRHIPSLCTVCLYACIHLYE